MFMSVVHHLHHFILLLGGYRNISNQYSIKTKIDKEHPGMREYAKSKGWWDGESQFNFATVYSFTTTARIEASRSRYCEGKKLLKKSNGLSMHTSLYTSGIMSGNWFHDLCVYFWKCYLLKVTSRQRRWWVSWGIKTVESTWRECSWLQEVWCLWSPQTLLCLEFIILQPPQILKGEEFHFPNSSFLIQCHTEYLL